MLACVALGGVLTEHVSPLRGSEGRRRERVLDWTKGFNPISFTHGSAGTVLAMTSTLPPPPHSGAFPSPATTTEPTAVPAATRL